MFRNKPPIRVVQNTTYREGAYLGTSLYRTGADSSVRCQYSRDLIAPYIILVPGIAGAYRDVHASTNYATVEPSLPDMA
eukprot:3423017-Rhodomonas_salina.1